MSERIRGSYDDALYKSTYTLLTFTISIDLFVTKMFPAILKTCLLLSHIHCISFVGNPNTITMSVDYYVVLR